MRTEHAHDTGLYSADSILLDLELMVARRADELLAGNPQGANFDRQYWNRAEQEILASGSAGLTRATA